MKKPIVVSLSVAAVLSLTFHSDCSASGYEFEGIGAREVSRAGAAIADSADWSAIYWNPANVRKAADAERANVGVEIFGGDARAKDSNSLSSLPVGAAFSKDKLSSSFVLGAAGAAMKVGRFGLGFGFYTPLLQGVDFSDTSSSGMHLEYKGSAGIITSTLEGAMKVTSNLYFGAGINLLYGKIKSDSTLTNFPVATNTAESHLDGDGVAPEGIFGLRYEPSPKWIVGAVYRTGADVAIRGSAKVTNTFFPTETSNFRYELRHPPTSGIGVAYRATERWSLHGDFTQTYWRRFTSAFAYDNDGTFIRDTGNTFNWRNTWKARLGTGFQLTDKTDIVGGYSYDRYALDAGSVDLASTVDVSMNRVYVGAGHKWTDRWETIFGGVYGSGRRNETNVNYRLSGWQLMLETQFHLGRLPT